MPAINTRSSGKQIVVDLEPLGRRVPLEKDAIHSGIDILLKSAIRIGMFPTLPIQRFTQVENAAGAGACLLLTSSSAQQAALGTCPQGELRGIDHLGRVYGSLHRSAAPVNKQAA